MVHLSRTKDVQATRESVFQYFTEVERFPAVFPDIFSKMDVVSVDGNSRVLACEEKWAGHAFNYTMKEELSPPEEIVRTITRGSGKGTRVSITLSPSPEGTRVSIDVEARGPFAALCGGLSRGRFEKEVERIFEGYAMVAEAGAANPNARGTSAR